MKMSKLLTCGGLLDPEKGNKKMTETRDPRYRLLPGGLGYFPNRRERKSKERGGKRSMEPRQKLDEPH